VRAAVSQLITVAKAHGCEAIAIESLDFAAARAEGRETLGRGRRGKQFRRTVAGSPTKRFRDRLLQLCANQGIWVVAVDPAYTSRWGDQRWHAPLAPTKQDTGRRIGASCRGGGDRTTLAWLPGRRRPGVPPTHRRMGVGESYRPGQLPILASAGPGPLVRPGRVLGHRRVGVVAAVEHELHQQGHGQHGHGEQPEPPAAGACACLSASHSLIAAEGPFVTVGTVSG
jgi:hypothetical protein